MRRNQKFKLAFLLVFRGLLFIAMIAFVLKGDWFNLLLSILTLALTFLPSILEKKLKVDYPEEFEIIILLFIFASLFLGDIVSFFEKYVWWDVLLHGLSAIILGIIAFSLIYILNKEGKVSLKPGFIALFAFCFALAAGAIWELFEFLVDFTLKTNMQKSGLVDTMIDLIVDMIGALLISVIGFLYAKGHLKFLRALSEDFVKANPDIFRE